MNSLKDLARINLKLNNIHLNNFDNVNNIPCSTFLNLSKLLST